MRHEDFFEIVREITASLYHEEISWLSEPTGMYTFATHVMRNFLTPIRAMRKGSP
jgi:hypothetical protein